jgi:F1F0 ATPase subunit 2
MTEILSWVLAFVAGLSLGAIFFGGLWWTVRAGAASSRPAQWFVGSLLLRMAIALAGLHFVGHGKPERLLLCLLGFTVARFVVTWMTRPSRDVSHGSPLEVIHAP